MISVREGKMFYLILFSIGLLSLPLGLLLVGALSGVLISLQNTLCDLGWCGDIPSLSPSLFPFLICSILLAVVLYFKERSFVLALKFFVISFAAISLLFFGGLSFLYRVQPQFTFLPSSPFPYFLLILVILFIVGRIAFKRHPLFGFAIRAFAISFAVLLLATSALFIGMMYVTYELGEASTSASIYITSGAETITIYLPALLEANGSVLMMYKTPSITDNVTAIMIDTEKGKAFKISGSGLGRYLFSWSEVPGNDSVRLIKWMEDGFLLQQGEKPDVRKSDDGRTIIVSVSGKDIYTFRLHEDKSKISVFKNDDFMDEYFLKDADGELKVYTGKIEIRMNEKHGRLEDEAREEFLKKFTISMSNYTPSLTPPDKVDAWVYSDGEVEQLSLSFIVDPGGGTALSIETTESVAIDPQNGAVNIERTSLNKGWQAVKLNAGFLMYD